MDDQMHNITSTPWIWCPTHSKRAYPDQGTADRARVKLTDAAVMEAYPCTGKRAGHWHIGHKTRRVQALDRIAGTR